MVLKQLKFLLNTLISWYIIRMEKYNTNNLLVLKILYTKIYYQQNSVMKWFAKQTSNRTTHSLHFNEASEHKHTHTLVVIKSVYKPISEDNRWHVLVYILSDLNSITNLHIMNSTDKSFCVFYWLFSWFLIQYRTICIHVDFTN